MSIKKDILIRVNVVFIILCAMGSLIIAQAFRIQTFEGKKWRDEGRKSTRIDTIEGDRGNIYSEDGRLLATSLPSFDIYMDMTVAAETTFKNGIDSLCIGLAQLFDETGEAEDYKTKLVDARKKGNAYLEIQKSVNFTQLQSLKKLPILRLGKFKGGIITRSRTKRVQPFNPLAQRTIGYARTNAQSVGLEGAFDNYLRGQPIIRLMQKVRGGGFIALNDDLETGNYNGKDVYTTIDINLQDVVENALSKTLNQFKAAYGCAIVMEVKTGKIKAIANLGISTDTTVTYWEKYNYAIGNKTEPGSTFKVASLAALLDDNYVTDTTKVDTEWGKKKFYDKLMSDSHPPEKRILSVRRIMETSSNVGIAKLIEQFYGNQPKKFVEHLEKMHLHQPTGIEIEGEPTPTIKRPGTQDWSGVTLPFMAIGYETELTPLQILCLYNAIANNGTMMKPYLVTDVKEFNYTLRHFDPTVLAQNVCKPQTAKLITNILEGVLEEGTAKALYTGSFSIAGKTGTAKIAKDKQGYKDLYQASIAGYFPANDPLYSCIVVINSPTGNDYYGASVAGPVFKEIVEKCYSLSTQHHKAINQTKQDTLKGNLPLIDSGFGDDIRTIYNQLHIPTNNQQAEWLSTQRTNDTVWLRTLPLIDNLIPNVKGMGLRDAVFMLESKGLKVRFAGQGKVKAQRPAYGTRYRKGDVVYIELK